MSVVKKTADALDLEQDPDESILEIDEERLDYEWIRQGKIFYRYALAVAKCRAELDTTKANFDLVQAELSSDIRNDPESHHLTKVTEGAIQEAMLKKGEYKVAQKKVHKAKYRLDVYEAMVKALDHKKKGLEALVTLRGQEYHAAPRSPKEMRGVTEEYEKKAARKSQRRPT